MTSRSDDPSCTLSNGFVAGVLAAGDDAGDADADADADAADADDDDAEDEDA